MAEESALMDEKKLTELRAKPYTVENSLSERSISGSKNTENTSGEHTAAGCLTMGSSIQPSKGNTDALTAEKEPPKQDDSYPSSLRSSSTSCSSYSLEISVSTTATNNSDKECRPLPLKTPPESRDEAKSPSPEVYQKSVPSVTKSYRPSDPKQLQENEQLVKLQLSPCLDKHSSSEIVTSKNQSTDSRLEKTFLSSPGDDGKLGAQPVSTSQLSKATTTQQCRKPDSFSKEMRADQGEEDRFYAFVILHAQEDAEEAERLKSRLESISSTIGATFSEDFAVPGLSIFRSVEDAIENSAYVMLLLTSNFNTHLNETNADSALMNSIDKPHKYNTVIPLLPRANGLTRDQMPYTLKTKNPLDETRGSDWFEKMAQKVLNSKKIETHKSMWTQEQLLKKQQKKKQMLQEERRHYEDRIRETSRVREEEERLRQLQMHERHRLPPGAHQPNSNQGFSGGPHASFGSMPFQSPNLIPPYYGGNMWQQPPPSIHIQNAKCIMIGNNSTMTVGGSVDSLDEDNL